MYSKIVSVIIENMMTIKEAELVIGEDNILNLCGYNNSGKSAITRGLEILLYDAYANEQVHYIHGEEDYFKVGMRFEDGRVVSKTKFRNGKGIWEIEKEGVIEFTNRVGDSVIAMNGVPEVISNYLGVMIDDNTGEKLNVRRNTDRLFLIDTTGGDNYKIVNVFLRTEVLAKASMNVTKDKNNKEKEIQVKRIKLDSTKEDLEKLFINEGIIADTENQLNITRKGVTQYKGIGGVNKAKTVYEDIVIADKLNAIDTDRLSLLEDIRNILTIIEKPIYKEVESVNVDRVEKLRVLQREKAILDTPMYGELNIVDLKRVDLLRDIDNIKTDIDTVIPNSIEVVKVDRQESLKLISDVLKELSTIDTVVSDITTEKDLKMEELKKYEGVKFCKNCGEVVAD